MLRRANRPHGGFAAYDRLHRPKATGLLADRIAMPLLAAPHPPSPPHALQSLCNVLQAKGFAASDFELAEGPAPFVSDVFADFGSWMRVRCRSTGEERLYTVGAGSAWLGAFLMDLGGGHFSGAARFAQPNPS